MGFSLLGKKVGMTRVYTDSGASVPVTVIECGPCVVTQIKTVEKDGYTGVQIGYGEAKARNTTIPLIAARPQGGNDP